MTTKQNYFFTLNVSYEKCITLYQAGNNSVILRSDSGEKIQLPTKNLRPFIQRNGLIGRFRLVIDSNNKVQSFDKIN